MTRWSLGYESRGYEMSELERLYEGFERARELGNDEMARQIGLRIREQRIKETNMAETQDQAMAQAGIEQQLNAAFDPSQGLNDFWKRFDLARTVTPEDRQRKLQAQMPNADVRTVTHQRDPNLPGKPVTVYRPEGEEAFRPVAVKKHFVLLLVVV